MSVIPFIIGEDGRTVVETEAAYRDAEGLDGEMVFIQNLDTEQLNAPEKTNVSYDLRIGREYRDHRDPGKTQVPEDEAIVLHPGSAIIVETEEFVHFPKTRFGQIVPKVSLLQEGISNTSSKVDPGFNGILLVTVFNLGKKPVHLHKGQAFCALYILRVDPGVRPYSQIPPCLEGAKRLKSLRKVDDWLQRNTSLIGSVSIILSILVLGVFLTQIIVKSD